LREQAAAAEQERQAGAANHPLVQAVLARFPGAQIVNVVERAKDDGPGPDAETDILGEADALAAHEAEQDNDLE